ncbi:MAG: hypothetical protein SGI99_09330 [Pseudomonadota bacterium]|nr:hypothetical protein [Pseudomonadota bacterium]
MGFLAALSADGKTALSVTHEHDLSRFFTRTITLRDGAIESDSGERSDAPALEKGTERCARRAAVF